MEPIKNNGVPAKLLDSIMRGIKKGSSDFKKKNHNINIRSKMCAKQVKNSLKGH